MSLALPEQLVRAEMRERQLQAAQRNRAARVVNARRLEQRAAAAGRRARAARAALR